jgi:hypothetical protein
LRIVLLPILLFFIAGCTTSHEKLESYVGQDIQEVVADYGNPDVAFVMGNGRRDFQWTMKMSSSMPAQAISPGALTNPADQFNPDIEVSPLIPMYGGQAVASECSYIMITHWDEANKKWIVKAYQKPKSGC